MSGKGIFVYVQHLLGIGHLQRAATLARALAAHGLEVTLASGGFAPEPLALDGVRLVQLPPTGAADASFKVLIDAEGRPIDDAWRARRREALLEAWRAAQAQALVIELFPFGRRQMRFELLPLLEEVRAGAPRPLVVCSVRDVLGGSMGKPGRMEEILGLVERYFDRVLVHGDPALIPFERSFGHAGRLGERLQYTGYIVDAPTAAGDSQIGAGEVIVSAGGGAVGQRLLESAIRARAQSGLAACNWRVLAGANLGETAFQALAGLGASLGEGRVVVERARRDFTTLLANCLVSVSQGGYNTIMETLQAGTRALVVPFAGGNEIEQTIRAQRLAERGLIELLEEHAMTPASLAAAIDRAARRPRIAPGSVDLDGARRSAELLARWSSERAR